ncbi:hypothetical protein BRADI_1g17760v3 [Brachypodium distachyon]|uniref:OVATE domain-containing protein n=1 Tax=Brachypodium distachyon TaxID=15368 RepID=A0A0Q3J9S3_BRADI|nr:hypothetical protein BRADI_1g17760v3 [Brachypodium distachyon]
MAASLTIGSCSGMLAVFGRRRPRAPAPEQQQKQPTTTRLHRAFGRMKAGHRRRRRAHRASSFSSVRAVFWPLMSMGSDADRASDIAGATADHPPQSSPSSAVRAPSPSLADTPASTTAARVLAIQARLADADADASTAARLIALQARLGGLALASPSPVTKPPSTLLEPFDRTRLIISGGGDDGGVEEACRGFERQLMEMLVEEGKVGDLTDVEELLGCWEKLSSPDFVTVVGRFYGDLCVDLFSGLGVDVSPSDGSAV